MRRRILITAALIALLVFAPPLINLKRYRTQIAHTVSASIGRNVTFSDVRFHLLPWPALVFANIVVAEDPSFGVEPMMSAPEVVASIRLLSLWRGRLEIARLSFASPSLNVVRNERGLWNIGGSLRQAASVTTAPTAAPLPGPQPRFPYVEISDARVNFKIGSVKQAFSLIDTDFSLWLEDPAKWQMRLAARPLRTDAYLADTGIIRAEAEFRREPGQPLEAMPLRASLRWENAQLGQATWLLTGEDRGWRGDLDARADATGNSQSLHLDSRISIHGFRRYNIFGAESMDVRAECTLDLVRKSTAQDMRFSAEDGDCRMPTGDGVVRVTGRGSFADKAYDAAVIAEKVPIRSFLNFYRRAKLNVSDSLSGSGTFDSNLRFASDLPCPTGTAQTHDVRFVDTQRDLEFDLGTAKFEPVTQARKARSASETCLSSTPIAVALGAKTPLTMRMEAAKNGLRVSLNGHAEAQRLLAAAKAFGLLVRDYRATGSIALDAALAIDPHGFRSAQWLGYATSDELALPQGITLKNAALAFNGDQISLQRFTTVLPEMDSSVSGSITWPLRCDLPPCPVRFALHATTLDVDAVNRAVNPSFRKRNWFYLPRFLGGNDAQVSPMSIMFVFKGSGTMQIDRLTLRRLILEDVTTDAAWDQDRLVLSNITGKTLGGMLTGNVELATRPFSGRGDLMFADADLNSTATLAGTQWARGRGQVNGNFSFSGSTATEIADSLQSRFDFTVMNGSLRRWAEVGDISFHRWSGKSLVKDRRLQIASSTLVSGATQQSLTGSVASDLSLDLRLQSGGVTTVIGGSLSVPVVRTETTPAQSASNRANESSPPSSPARR